MFWHFRLGPRFGGNQVRLHNGIARQGNLRLSTARTLHHTDGRGNNGCTGGHDTPSGKRTRLGSQNKTIYFHNRINKRNKISIVELEGCWVEWSRMNNETLSTNQSGCDMIQLKGHITCHHDQQEVHSRRLEMHWSTFKLTKAGCDMLSHK